MKTVGDYYSVIVQAEKTREKLIGYLQENNSGDDYFLTLQQACAYIRSYIEELKRKEVLE